VKTLSNNFNPDLIQKYNRAGPRYTSYPTALQFHNKVDTADLLRDLKATPGPLSLYLHLPFCESLCWFCACTTVITRNPDRVNGYLDALEKEIQLLAPHLPAREVAQLHYGGGSPSFLEPEHIRRLNTLLAVHFTDAPNPEKSVELDPRTLTEEKVRAFAEGGFTRASFGVQDVNPAVQQAVHRVQPDELNRTAISWIRTAGFDSLNLDLIYGLPKQTRESFAKTVDTVIEYNPDRIALFSYAHVPWVAPAQKILERSTLPPPEEKLAMFQVALDRLTAAGYVFIGMDHFAKKTDELAKAAKAGGLHRNFQGYTTRDGLSLCGLGMSSISQSSRAYRQNFKTLDAYYGALEKNRLPLERGYMLSGTDLLRREIIMGLMCRFCIDIEEVAKAHDTSPDEFAPALAELETFAQDGLVEIEGWRIHVTPTGRFLIRNIAMVFDAYLRPAENRHARTI
jgi:oxygen-independent coproporphyrinogen-3 oxidase